MNSTAPLLSSVKDSQLLAALERERTQRMAENRLPAYRPYSKQADFHAAGAANRERLLMAANQVGKTLSAGFELAMHLTGEYPEWWSGKRFTRPIVAWAGGVTGESTRDNPQRILLGRPGEWGTGSIPKRRIEHITRAIHRVADSVDSVRVSHVSGGYSLLYFKSYDQGREKWQGETLDVVWFDEEPPEDIYTEGLTRTNATGGLAFVTFTPLLGMSNVVKRFLIERVQGTHITQMTIDDAEHYSIERRAEIVASYSAHEREARTKGIPALGSGRVFPVTDEQISIPAFEIPKHWARIVGLDFGWDHPTAAAWLAHDRDTDTIYVTDAYRVREQPVVVHAAAIRSRGKEIPIAWPHDGNNDTAAGKNLAQQYRDTGLPMLDFKATFEDGTNSVEAGVMLILDMMLEGRFKVFSHLSAVFEEVRLYHRKDGKIVKEMDDLISAIRYGVMMRREAKMTKAKTYVDPNDFAALARAQRHAQEGSWMR